ncbi:site-specific integrase [Alicyclobacillus acidoterrestris]|uniref:Tyrosine-type recombinase/integrase n=1 Tax=Alicyclobacillus acidoterrestris (strain ATCC 49025 / DSM 3922 / CIP 106132 / NCIMB 13137 / GD3B) TaxID=1356854 RepID=T0CJR2_ALIAG|nr:site-specific integrase [Alicyclobacillus acidoterrestris]EPZ52760.1 integrase [Alicyclobacillus acidoterrestris ATCC 49025]UNO49400.1 tyrosine-type recombinase/integrase [Alicyclobacillus acidoterrestris]
MDESLIYREATKVDTQLANLMASANEYVRRSKAQNTIKAYQSDWQSFSRWCKARGLCSLPAEPRVVALYLSDMADLGYKASTIGRHMISIDLAHKTKGYPSPTSDETVRSVWRGIRNTIGVAPSGKSPVLVEDLRRMLRHAPNDLMGLRDRALLLIGFAGAFRRSELVSLNVEDIEFTREGLVITLRRSKTDQVGEGRKVGIPYGSFIETCPVRALQAWLEATGIESGALFRHVTKGRQIGTTHLSDKSVARIVKKYIERIGLDESKFAGHSLRDGLATSAAMAGASERDIMAQTGHKNPMMVRRYIRDGNLFRSNAAARIGL